MFNNYSCNSTFSFSSVKYHCLASERQHLWCGSDCRWWVGRWWRNTPFGSCRFPRPAHQVIGWAHVCSQLHQSPLAGLTTGTRHPSPVSFPLATWGIWHILDTVLLLLPWLYGRPCTPWTLKYGTGRRPLAGTCQLHKNVAWSTAGWWV